jgi:hypothetical protein
MDFAWKSTAAAGTWFKIYEASAAVKVQTRPNARSAQIYINGEVATGGGSTCYWVAAVNTAGESARVPIPGQ